ncbi:MAG: four helix bundle protein [Maribacter sp.]|jgi:four helix bundle protein
MKLANACYISFFAFINSIKTVIMSFRDVLAYKKYFALAIKIFELSKSFPKEEKYSLIDQIRRSLRSVSANISEAYRKKRDTKNFISKLSDSDAENAETQTWLEFGKECRYFGEGIYKELNSDSEKVGRLINYMINNPGKFGVKEE